MTWYARPSWRLVRQVIADLFAVAWIAGWWLVGRFVDAAVRAMAGPAREGARLASDLKGQLQDAATRTAELPLVGDQIRQPFDGMAGTAESVIAAANAQVAGIEQAATVIGLVTFALPALLLILTWLPARLSFASRARAAKELAAAPAGPELLALRALAGRPMPDLAKVAPDPMAAWRAGDAAVIAKLADLELDAAGVRPLSAHRTTRR